MTTGSTHVRTIAEFVFFSVKSKLGRLQFLMVMWIVHFLLPILPPPMFCVGDLVTRAPAKGLTTGSLLQEVDLTPTAP